MPHTFALRRGSLPMPFACAADDLAERGIGWVAHIVDAFRFRVWQ
jgi:hypothetical protein